MTVYRIWFLTANGSVTAVQRFSADTDEEALSVARLMGKGRSQLSGFELWEGRRKVRGEGIKREPQVR